MNDWGRATTTCNYVISLQNQGRMLDLECRELPMELPMRIYKQSPRGGRVTNKELDSLAFGPSRQASGASSLIAAAGAGAVAAASAATAAAAAAGGGSSGGGAVAGPR